MNRLEEKLEESGFKAQHYSEHQIIVRYKYFDQLELYHRKEKHTKLAHHYMFMKAEFGLMYLEKTGNHIQDMIKENQEAETNKIVRHDFKNG